VATPSLISTPARVLGPLSLRLLLRRPGAWFLCSGLVVRVFLLWCIVGMVGATSGQINLHQLCSHNDLYGGVSELMATYVYQSFRSAAWSSCCSSELARSVARRVLAAGARWFLWSKDVDSEVVDLQFFSDFVDVKRRILVQDTTGTSLRSTCHNDMCLATCSEPVHRLTKPRWRWCFLGSSNGRGSAFLLACVSAVLELDGGRWLRWL
jgi:hypothetical protein